ncbi:cbh2 [Symbiodinium natans]|uniref:Cbh2 protein n=1 Tax=Symbiodinium natans TaxID=878477 RepID=A0A812V784_9DINO|nr:cbh2 [Symbiodinium natans]
MSMKLLVLVPVTVVGHSYLALPPSRNLLANLEGREDCPHCLQSGGPDNVKERGGGVWPTRLAPGSHGLCGDPVQGQSNPVRLEDETYLKTGPVTATYEPGEVVEFQVAVSTHHQGHYEFRICDKPLDAGSLASAADGQACLDQWLLQRAPPLANCVVNDPRGDCQPLDPKHPERWYLPPAGSQTPVAGRDFNDSMAPAYPSSAEVHRMRFKIPAGLQCSRCTLQWYWSSGNSCYYDGDYFDYYRGIAALGWDAAAWQPQILEDWANCGNSCCRSGGTFGEEFWNCADISVAARGSSSSTTPEPSTTTSAVSTSTTVTTTHSATIPLFSPVDGGEGRACRGRNAQDNAAAYYAVFNGMPLLDDCKAKCIATAGCVGIEHSSGRCEVWTRPEGIQASISLRGFTCLRLGEASTTSRPALGTFEPIGEDKACRGASSRDNSPGYYSVFFRMSLDECKVQCALNEDCRGIEHSKRGRCEVWVRAIEASADVPGFSCYTYTSPGAPSTSTTSSPRACSRAWAACGGQNWDGPTCCEDGHVCFAESVWYSQCRPAATLAEMPGLAPESRKHRRFRGSTFLQDGTLLDHTLADEEL